MEHEHEWKPAEGHFGKYECVCGATGSKPRHGENCGKVVAHKHTQRLALDQRVFVGKANLGVGCAHRGKSGPGAW